MSFTLRSSAFVDGGEIPLRYSAEGDNMSPPLSWGALPRGIKELAVICLDTDPRLPRPWVHWLLYKIPTHVSHIDEGLPFTSTLRCPALLYQGLNSWGKIGYAGPFPPLGEGRHSYSFRLYALGTELEIEPGLSLVEFTRVMDGHVRTQTELVGFYQAQWQQRPLGYMR